MRGKPRVIMPPRVRGMKHAARRIDHLVGAGEVAANGPDGSRSRTGWPRIDRRFPRRRQHKRATRIWMRRYGDRRRRQLRCSAGYRGYGKVLGDCYSQEEER